MAGFKFFCGLAAAAVLGGAVANAAVTRADDQNAASGGTGASDEKCLVQVDRAASAGSFAVTRLVRKNGQCVCIAKTGPQNQGGSAESAVTSLLSSRSCADAPPAIEQAAANTGGGNGVLGVIGAGVVGGALAAAAGGSDSPGS